MFDRTSRLTPDTLTIAEEFAKKISDEQRINRLVQLIPRLTLLFFVVCASLFISGFFTLTNATNLLNQAAIPLILATGLTNVILIGGIDLSLEGVMGFSGSVVTLLVLNNRTSLDFGFMGIVFTILLGTGVGALTGVLHVKLRIPSFMVSFGMGSVLTGFGVMSYQGKPATVLYELFPAICRGSLIGIPY